jgi:hypothetical protein
MGRKNLVYDFKPINDGDLSLASITGQHSDVSQYDTVTYEADWSGGQATNGNLEIEYCRDEKITSSSVWKTLPLDGTPALDTAADTHLIIITEIGFKWLRPKYTRTNVAASGLLTVGIFQSNKGA